MTSRREEKERLREERLAREREAERAAAQRRRLWMAGAAAVTLAAVAAAVILIAGGGGSSNSSNDSNGSASGGALLASTANAANGETVDGIQCQTSEQVLFHIHAHLAILVNGKQRLVPEGIGITPPRTEQQSAQGPFVVNGSCFYWLHSHTADGIIHIESPVQRTYTLGDYFDIWKQPLGPNQVGPAKGPVIAYLNGRPFSGNPRAISLSNHALIQLDVGTPAPGPKPFSFPSGP
jgi:hypothetical protein